MEYFGEFVMQGGYKIECTSGVLPMVGGSPKASLDSLRDKILENMNLSHQQSFYLVEE